MFAAIASPARRGRAAVWPSISSSCSGWIARFRDGTVSAVAVTDEATTQFNDDVESAMEPTVWNTGCNSWYLTDANTIDLWPYDLATLVSMLDRPDERHFHLS
jgi:hypothetical protein